MVTIVASNGNGRTRTAGTSRKGHSRIARQIECLGGAIGFSDSDLVIRDVYLVVIRLLLRAVSKEICSGICVQRASVRLVSRILCIMQGRREHGDCHGDQDGDDRNDDQELSQSKTTVFRGRFLLSDFAVL